MSVMHSRGHRSRSRRGVYVLLALAVVVIIVIVVVALKSVAGIFSPAADYSGTGYGSVQVHVASGDTQTQIGQTLYAADVVESVGAYTSAASSNPKSTQIQPGYYRLRHHMSGASAVAALLDPKSLLQQVVVIPEGFTAADIVSRIVADTTITQSQLQAALHDPSALGLPSWAKGHAEGLLYPATYDFPPDTTATEALSQMVARFKQEAQALHINAASHRVGLTPYQVVTLASIVQAEGKLPQYLPRIAEVFLNRLQQRRPLGSNATLYYVLGHNHGPLTNSDLHLNSPYNTEFQPGLPPTPINSPGELTLRAVLHPAHGNLLYFVTVDAAGHVGFASTEAGYQQLVAKARRNGQQ